MYQQFSLPLGAIVGQFLSLTHLLILEKLYFRIPQSQHQNLIILELPVNCLIIKLSKLQGSSESGRVGI